ncbi:hypothetical protein [Nocardioides sp. URHA0020]|uniref:hypothetical protein n=1 Tax=Nocardioides sp. URHA0020 TaxID=1380392 RepID=UPI0004912EB7|nr:hypothetical protein [Nocardioides sp. URHA0020]
MNTWENSGPVASESLDALMAAFLSSVSFASGHRPDYDGIRALVIDAGLLIKNVGGQTEASTVEEFIAPRLRLVDDGILTEFREEEVSTETLVFGTVAHRWSVYAKSGVQGGTAFSTRGVILTQFVETYGGWRISSMTWDDERPGLTLADMVRHTRPGN